MEKHFKGFKVEHIHRNDSNEGDDLAKRAAKNEELSEDVIYEVMIVPSIKKQYLIHIRQEDWMAPILSNLKDEFEPCSTNEAKRIPERARGYSII